MLLEFGTDDQLQLNALLGGRAFTAESPNRLVGFTSFGAEVRPGVMAYDQEFLYAWADYMHKDRGQLDAILADLDPRVAYGRDVGLVNQVVEPWRQAVGDISVPGAAMIPSSSSSTTSRVGLVVALGLAAWFLGRKR